MFAAAVLLLTAGPASADTTYHYTGRVWDASTDFPLPWYQASQADDQLDPDYQTEVLQKGFQNWEDSAICAKVSDVYEGIRTDTTGGWEFDYYNTMSWDDPTNENGAGVLGATLCQPQTGGDTVETIEGEALKHQFDCDIVFNDDVAWGETADIEAGICANEYAIEAVATHEIGHLFGLDHSCEEDEDCPDPGKRNATMYWSTGPCDAYQATPKDWDIEALTSLYGPFVTFQTTENDDGDGVSGGVPLEVCFELDQGDAVVDSVSWRLGDGTTSTEVGPCHTYTTKGQYTVSADVIGHTDVCDTFEYTHYKNAFVVACEPPSPAEGFDGMFTYEPGDGLQVQLVNQADTTVYGCIDQIQWDIFQGDTLVQSINAWSPIVEFPSEGTYRVVLNLGGPGGTAAEELEIDVADNGSGGCSTAPGFGLVGAAIGLGLALSRRRTV